MQPGSARLPCVSDSCYPAYWIEMAKRAYADGYDKALEVIDRAVRMNPDRHLTTSSMTAAMWFVFSAIQASSSSPSRTRATVKSCGNWRNCCYPVVPADAVPCQCGERVRKSARELHRPGGPP